MDRFTPHHIKEVRESHHGPNEPSTLIRREPRAAAPLVPVPGLDQVAADPTLAATLPRETAVSLYVQAARVEAALRGRLLGDLGPRVPVPGAARGRGRVAERQPGRGALRPVETLAQRSREGASPAPGHLEAESEGGSLSSRPSGPAARGRRRAVMRNGTSDTGAVVVELARRARS